MKALTVFNELNALFRLDKDPSQGFAPRIAQRSSRSEDDGHFPLNEVGALLERTWWGRIWVVQELAFANDISFVCGYDAIPGKCIQSFLKVWDSMNRGFVPRMMDHRPWALFEVRDSVQTGSPLSIKDILQIASKAQLEASDPRDHIFALLGLMKEGEQLKGLVDYDKLQESYIDVYVEVAKTLLDENDLWIFSFCHFLGSPTPSLPSWVPDWSRQSGQIPLLQTGGAAITGKRSPFCAWNGAQPSATFIDQIPPRLAVSGIEVDTVARVGSLRPAALFNDLNGQTRSRILVWLQSFRDLVPEDCILGSKYREEALWRTPIADQWRDVGSTWIRPEPWIREVYNHLVNLNSQQLSSEDYTVQYFEYVTTATNRRIPFSTKKGYLGLGSEFVLPGDLVILFGSDVPVVLRQTGDMLYTLIGEAYVTGIMYGEIVKEMRGHPRRSETFELV